MIADIIVKVAGFEKKEDSKYYPRPSLAGPERCIRQMVYWGSGIPKNKEMSDRLMMTINDSLWHEQLTADWLRKSAFQLSSEQMGVDCEELDFIEPPISDKNDKVIVNAVSTIKETPDEVEGTPYEETKIEAFKTLARHGYRYCSYCEKAVPRNRLHGHIDGVLTDMLMQDYHYEHKALSTYTFARYWAGEYPIDYITQTCLYNKGLRKVNPDIDTSALVIKNKNTAQYIDYKILYDAIKDSANILEICHSSGEKKIENPYVFSIENIISDAMKKFRTIDEHIKSHTLPDRPYEMDHWRCSYCQYSETCWKDYEKEFASLVESSKIEGEVVDLCRLYLQLVNTEKDAKEHKDELRLKIVTLLKEQGIKKGKTGEGNPGDYTINYQVSTQKRLKKMEDIPKELLPLIIHEIPMERLTIRLIQSKNKS